MGSDKGSPMTGPSPSSPSASAQRKQKMMIAQRRSLYDWVTTAHDSSDSDTDTPTASQPATPNVTPPGHGWIVQGSTPPPMTQHGRGAHSSRGAHSVSILRNPSPPRSRPAQSPLYGKDSGTRSRAGTQHDAGSGTRQDIGLQADPTGRVSLNPVESRVGSRKELWIITFPSMVEENCQVSLGRKYDGKSITEISSFIFPK